MPHANTFLEFPKKRNFQKKESFVKNLKLFFKISKVENIRAGSPALACRRVEGGFLEGRRSGKVHYTHEAEERNKIKFLILVESFINFILLSSLLSSVFNLSWLCFLIEAQFQGGIKQMLD